MVEQRPFKADVEGSSPSWVTFLIPISLSSKFLVYLANIFNTYLEEICTQSNY